MAYTRAQVRTLIRQRCDLENTTAQQDTEIDNHINDAAAYLHDFLIATYGNRYDLNIGSLATVAGTSSYALALSPALYKPVGVKLAYDDVQWPLDSFDVTDEPINATSDSWGPGNMPEYAMALSVTGGVTLLFNPPPDAVHSVKLYYHRTAPTYTADGDTVGIPHVDLLVIEACIRVKDKEERLAQRLMTEREMIQKRIQDWVAPLDAANPAHTLRAPRSRIAYRGRVF